MIVFDKRSPVYENKLSTYFKWKLPPTEDEAGQEMPRVGSNSLQTHLMNPNTVNVPF